MRNSSNTDEVLEKQFRQLNLPIAYTRLLTLEAKPSAASMDFKEKLADILQAQIDADETKKIERLMKKSRLCDDMPDVSRITYEPERELKKSTVEFLCQKRWVENTEHTWIAITGQTGTGKTFLAKAILRSLIEKGVPGVFYEMPEFLETMAQARQEGQFKKLLKSLDKLPLIVLDDFQLGQCEDVTRRDFLAFIRHRYERAALIITSQYPVSSWYDYIGVNDQAIREGIIDRLVNGCFKIELAGPSLRERRKNNIR